MPAPRCRPFTVLDGMILVAATAVGLAIGLSMRSEAYHLSNGSIGIGEWPSIDPPDYSGGLLHWKTYRETHRLLQQVAGESTPLMFPWTLAVLGLRLRRPRPTLRRLARQPGFAACASVAMMAVVGFLGHLSSTLEPMTWGDGFRFRWWLELINFRETYLTLDASYPALLSVAVASAWALLALGRMARPEPGWLDRAGRVLGAYWVAVLVLSVSLIA